MSTKPTLETCAGLYRAASDRVEEALRGVARAMQSAKSHGYGEQEIVEAAFPEKFAQSTPPAPK